MQDKPIALFGYSGHAYVVCDILLSTNQNLIGYLTEISVDDNPYHLSYLGFESNSDDLDKLKNLSYFVAIGNNVIRKKITNNVSSYIGFQPTNAIAKQAVISPTASLGVGVMVSFGSIINAKTAIGNGVICNTGCVIEHECTIGNYCHIAPRATLCGNVIVGENSFIGAGTIVKEGVKIGSNVVVGAGTVVIHDISDGQKVVGNPQRHIK